MACSQIQFRAGVLPIPRFENGRVRILAGSITAALFLKERVTRVNREFTRILGAVLSRPARLPVPRFGPRLLLGSELADALLFTSARVQPAALESSGFAFSHSDLEVGLRHMLKVPAS